MFEQGQRIGLAVECDLRLVHGVFQAVFPEEFFGGLGFVL